MYIPNPNKPGELSTLRQAIDEIKNCRSKGGGWRMGELERRLNFHINQMDQAIEILDQVMDQHYPPLQVAK